MKITYRHQDYEVDPCTLILRGDSFYARIQVAGVRVPMSVYVKVDPPPAVSWIPAWVREPMAIVAYVPSPYDFKTLWLQLANGILEMSRRKLDIRVVIADTEILGMVA